LFSIEYSFLFNVTGTTSLHLDLALRHCQLMRTCWSKNCQTLCHCHGRVLAIGGLSPLLFSLGAAPLSAAEPSTHDSGLYLTTKNVHVVKLSKRRMDFTLHSTRRDGKKTYIERPIWSLDKGITLRRDASGHRADHPEQALPQPKVGFNP
jgi:hypothetical protein